MVQRAIDPEAADRARWLAVSSHDRRADGTFVYAVVSTGIYCRPSCGSRRPRRDRVLFFEAARDAERAGYRACRRCHPALPVADDPWSDRIRRACTYLSRLDGHPSLTALAKRVGSSPWHFHRNFKRIVGITPREYAEACRLRRVKDQLRNGSRVTAAVFDAGYGSMGRFYERAAPKLGMRPAAYRQGGAGVEIRYAAVEAPVGRLLVAATSRGVCTVALGDDDDQLVRLLSKEYPAASISRDDRALVEWTRAIVRHLAGKQPALSLPLDVRATSFQWRVWKALAAIPYGETRSYAEIAAAIGRPTAARAVARACGTNPVAIAIPCHRVIPAAGGLGGYRWGADRKKQLIERERRS